MFHIFNQLNFVAGKLKLVETSYGKSLLICLSIHRKYLNISESTNSWALPYLRAYRISNKTKGSEKGP
jgi:hypothetical protein